MNGSRAERPDDPDVAGLAGLYALDALEGDDLVRFEQYLAEHPDARDEVDGFRATAARLAETSATAAPGSMRDDVLGRLGQVRQEPQRLDELRARRQRRASRAVAGVAAAAALVLVGALGGFLLGRSSDAGSPGSQERAVEVLRAEDARVVDLAGDLSGTTRLLYSPSTGEAVVLGDGLDAAPDGRVYALWRIRDDEPVPAGTFRPGTDGTVEFAADLGFDDGDTVGITLEPEGGSAAPTLPILSAAQL